MLACLIANTGTASAVTRKEVLGKQIFNDTNLSSPPGQACASCHSPDHFFIDPDQNEPTSEGVIDSRYGSRNAPTILYAASSPLFHFEKEEGLYIGGQFDDGRAKDLKVQARQPFLQAQEMNNSSPEEVVMKVRDASYAGLFISVYGAKSLDNPATAYTRILDAISAFERTPAMSPFRSKYDRYLQGLAVLTLEEARGREIFERADKGNCAACHPSRPSDNGRQRPLFTDHTYDNIGVPRNPANRFYTQAQEFNPQGYDFVDIGLGDNVNERTENGKFKVPTLRNIAKTGPYTHNGYFKTLRGVINFYNTRDVKPTCPDRFTSEEKAMAMGCWPVPEVKLNENHAELGHLGLSGQEEADLEAFLNTLTDDL